MDDKPENPDLAILKMQAYLTWNEVDGLLFHCAYKQRVRGLEDVRRGIQNLFEETLLNTRELESEAVTSSHVPIHQKIKKGEMCGWLMEKRVLALLEEKRLTVPAENMEFIKQTAKETKGAKSPDKEKAVKRKQVSKTEAPVSKPGRGRPPFPYSTAFVKAVKAQDKKGVSKNEIPFTAPVTRIFARNVLNEGRVMDEVDYKKAYDWSLRIVRKNVERALSE